ncbi:MAG: hypothetical protein ACR2NA_12665 [Solirubrobacterales bacterium]
MTTENDPHDHTATRDAGSWAAPVSRLTRPEVADTDAINKGVEGMSLTGPIRGFGKLWQKRYEVALAGAAVTPEQVIEVWKAEFRDFWPESNRFHAPLTGIAPGEVGLINATVPGRLQLSTGVFVLFSDEHSFAFMTPEGHLFAAWITFSARERDGVTHASVEIMMRASDPIFKLVLTFGGHRMEDAFWTDTLLALAGRFDVEDAEPQMTVTCVDRRRQWRHARNVRHNAGMRATLYAMGAPLRYRRGRRRAGAR